MAEIIEWVLQSRHIVTPLGIREGAVLIRNGTIQKILSPSEIPQGISLLNVGDRIVMPGVVDTHVHINEPGRTEWEGLETATCAAAAGGVTTLIDMPLNNLPVTTTLEAFRVKTKAAKHRIWVDCGFWGGLIPGNLAELEPMAEAGVMGFKAFLCPSGIPEFSPVTEDDLERAMLIIAQLGLPLLVHAELELSSSGHLANHAKLELPNSGTQADADPRRYSTYLASRPAAWEQKAIELLLKLCRETGCAVHIVHLSSADALPLLAQAKEEGLPFTAETCPHYLCFAAEEIPDGRTEFKCSPPIRERENRERLWTALKEGLITCIVSDHSPCIPALKECKTGNFTRAWGGIASLQWSLSVVWTEARKRGFTMSDLQKWMCEGPARLAGFLKHKGQITPGADADLVVWDPETSFILEPSRILHRHPVTPYLSQSLYGIVEMTFLRGNKIFDHKDICASLLEDKVFEHNGLCASPLGTLQLRPVRNTATSA